MHHWRGTEKGEAAPLVQPHIVNFGDQAHAKKRVRVFREDFSNVGTEEGCCQALLAEMGLNDDGVNAEGRAVGVMRAHGIVLEGGAHAEGAIDEREQIGGALVKEAVKEGSGLGLPESHALQGGGFILSCCGGGGGGGAGGKRRIRSSMAWWSRAVGLNSSCSFPICSLSCQPCIVRVARADRRMGTYPSSTRRTLTSG